MGEIRKAGACLLNDDSGGVPRPSVIRCIGRAHKALLKISVICEARGRPGVILALAEGSYPQGSSCMSLRGGGQMPAQQDDDDDGKALRKNFLQRYVLPLRLGDARCCP